MTTPAEPDEPVIRTQQDVSDALTRLFLDNADNGDDAANDDLVEQLIEWKRKNRGLR